MLERFQTAIEYKGSLRRPFQAFAAATLASCLIAAPAVAGEPPDRIVSIGGATTEIVYALGEESRLVGVDTTSTYPISAKSKPSVGYMRQLSAEGILSLRPDLILMEDGAGPPQAVAVLDAAGISVIHVPAGHDAPSIERKIETVAKALGDGTAGAAMAKHVTARLDGLEAALAGIKHRKRVLFVLSMSGGRPMAAGAHTGGDAIIRLAGGLNVFSSVDGYKTVSAEASTSLAPDTILMMSHGGPSPNDTTVLDAPAIAGTPAGRYRSLIRMDGLYLLGFGPRTADAATDLARRLYPDLALKTEKQ